MNVSKIAFAYFTCLSLICASILGMFHTEFIDIEKQEISFYIQISSGFVCAVCLLLTWYYASIFVKKQTMKYIKIFIKTAVNLDVNKVSQEDMSYINSKLLFLVDKAERCRFLLYMYAIPFFVAFLTSCAMIFFQSRHLMLLILVSVFFIMISIKLAVRITRRANFEQDQSFLNKFSGMALSAARGIQFYSAQNLFITRFFRERKRLKSNTRMMSSKYIFQAILWLSGLFLLLCLAYIIKQDYISENLFDLSNNGEFFYSAIFFFVISFFAYEKYLEVKEIDLDDIIPTDCMLEDRIIENEKQLDTKNLFLAFHNVCLQEPTKVSDAPLLNELSFSVLPGEFVAITGENMSFSRYIFDLILKYYTSQSGNIYISGNKIESVSTSTIRKVVGIFEEGFGLIDGTVRDNLAIVSNDMRKLLRVADKVDLKEFWDTEVFDTDGKIQLNQDTVLRIQIARIFLQNPNILLIESPKHFETDESFELFNNFVSHISKRKTVIISTDSASLLVYSNKILYLGKTETLFGSHAELALNHNYQEYIKQRG